MASTDGTTGSGTPDDGTPDHTDEQMMELLEDHVPLSLIMDLATPSGPDSREILATEGAPDEAWWVAP